MQEPTEYEMLIQDERLILEEIEKVNHQRNTIISDLKYLREKIKKYEHLKIVHFKK